MNRIPGNLAVEPGNDEIAYICNRAITLRTEKEYHLVANVCDVIEGAETIVPAEVSARLFVAAPALLDVAREWIACWNSPRDMERIVKSADLIAKTEAAIAAASGRASP